MKNIEVGYCVRRDGNVILKMLLRLKLQTGRFRKLQNTY